MTNVSSRDFGGLALQEVTDIVTPGILWGRTFKLQGIHHFEAHITWISVKCFLLRLVLLFYWLLSVDALKTLSGTEAGSCQLKLAMIDR